MRDASRHPPRSHFRCLNQHCAWKSSHTDCDLMALRVNTSCSHCSMRGAIMNLWNDDMIRTYFIRRSSLWMIILHHSLILIDTETVTFPWLPLMLPPTLFLHLYPQVCVCVCLTGQVFLVFLQIYPITGSAGFMPATPATIRSSPTCVFNDQISPWIIARLYSVKIGVRHPRHRPCITAPLKLQFCCYLLQKLSSAIHYQWTPIQM